MKIQLMAGLLAAVLGLSPLVAQVRPVLAAAQENQFVNPDFESGLASWSLYLETGKAEQSVSDGMMVIDISDIGTKDYAVQAYYDGFKLQEGCAYHLAFDAISSAERTIQWRAQLNGGDYHAYASEIVGVGTELTHIEADFVMEEATDPAPRFCLNLGIQEGCPEDLNEHSIRFDNFELYLTDDSGAVSAEGQEERLKVNVNQVGYLPGGVKRAVVRGGDLTGGFELVAESGEIVYSGVLSEARDNSTSGEQVAVADFTDFAEPGSYRLRTDAGESPVFSISEDVYDELASDALHMFYLQRCGVVEDETYGHEACHTQSAEICGSDGRLLESRGGWHDAGDYGRYIVAGAKAVADLLLAWENYPEQFDGPALLEEVKYELDWMLTMQDESGGVYHKITGEVFPGVVLPEEETAKLIVSPISTAATGDFAAVMAMAARIYEDEEFKSTCLLAAGRAIAYLAEHPSDGIGFKNPDGIVTGEYGDAHDEDERFWAAAELYRTTGEEHYAEVARAMNLEEVGADLGWQSVGIYGIYAYLRAADEDDAFAGEALARLTTVADRILERAEADAYGAALAADEYVWGSNMCVADNGLLLLMADSFCPREDYVRTAEQQLSYLLGTNTTSYCFVTGYGERPAEHPHHRPSQYVGAAPKGMLVGGPDSYLEDPYAKNVLEGLPPAACYTDHDQSYSCNEVAIYWNSPLVYLLAGVRAAG